MENKLHPYKIFANPSFFHEVTCIIRLDHAGTVVKIHIHGFLLLEALAMQIDYHYVAQISFEVD